MTQTLAIDIIVSAVISAIVALVGWIIQSRQFRQEMNLKLKEWERKLPPADSVPRIVNPKTSPSKKPLPERSPYIVGLPIFAERDFYGRKDATEHFFNYLLGGQLQSVSIRGLRRSGKTSFLFHIRRPDIWEQRMPGASGRLMLVYVDLQSIAHDPGSFYNYVARLAVQVYEGLVKRDIMDLNLPETLDYDFLTAFFGKVSDIGFRPLLLLDEFEALAESKFIDTEFFDKLRGLLTRTGLALVTVTYRDVYKLTGKGAASPLLNYFYPLRVYMGALAPEDARQLVCKPAAEAGIVFDDTDVDFICALAGRLPYPLQVAADALFRARNVVQPSTDARTTVSDQFDVAMRKTFEEWWQQLSEAEVAALGRLACRLQRLPGDDAILADLARVGLTERLDGDYRVLGDAFTKWIIEVSATPQTTDTDH